MSFKRSLDSLKQDPIDTLDEETLRVGLGLFLRHLALALPFYALYVANVLAPRWLRRTLGENLLLALVLILAAEYIFSLGAAEHWRAQGDLAKAFRSPGDTLKLGFALWWRSFLSSIRFVWIPFVLGLATVGLFRRRTAESVLSVLEIVLVPVILIAAMGLGCRLLMRQRQIEAGDYVPGGKPSPAVAANSANPFR